MSGLDDFFQLHPLTLAVTLSAVRGSAPRGAGTVMYVSPQACFGSIGGGQLEYMAIDEARAILKKASDAEAGPEADPKADTAHMSVPLGPEIGQCCGGHVEITLTLMTPAARAAALRAEQAAMAQQPTVHIFGAGHVGRALAACLALVPLRTRLIDSRPEELARTDAAVEKHLTPLPEADIRSAAPGDAFVILTHDHALDFIIAAEALGRADAAYVGMIGSATKRATFVSWAGRDAIPPVAPDRLICPIGSQGENSGDKRPEIIAAFTAAEILDALARTAQAAPHPHAEKSRTRAHLVGTPR